MIINVENSLQSSFSISFWNNLVYFKIANFKIGMDARKADFLGKFVL